MTVFLTLEASQPCGKTYRLGFWMQRASGFDLGFAVSAGLKTTKGTSGNRGALFV
jgi:hypothetical protein